MNVHDCITSIPTRVLVAVLLLLMPLAATAAQGDRLEDHIVETETGIYYIIQPGDTLWDLSQQFSDSAWLWPDLWKENKDIPNPHLIYPGQRIRIYRRTDIDKMGPAETAEGLSADRGTYTYKRMDAVGFIRYPALTPSGVIFDVQEPKEMINTYDVVYIRPEITEDFHVGDRFTIYHTLEPIRDEKNSEIIGVQHLIKGIVEITDIQSEVITGSVMKTFRPLTVDDQVTPYLDRPASFPLKESVPGIEGKMISAEDHLEMIGEHHIAFIDKGSTDGIEVGQTYTAFDQEEKVIDKKTNKTVLLPKVKLGELLVLHTENTTSTVLVTQSNMAMPPETPICTPF